MNQANTICLLAVLYVMGQLASIFCFGLNPGNLGGYGIAMLFVALPLVTYALGRMWQAPTNRRSRRKRR